MVKKFFLFVLSTVLTCSIVQANVNKIAIVDVQKVVNKSAQVQALKKEEEAKHKEIAQLIKKGGEEIKAQTDISKRREIAQKYDKQIKSKQEANIKSYKAKLEAIDKNINTAIIQQAKAMGYDMVLTKGIVLYGGDDITDAILKIVK